MTGFGRGESKDNHYDFSVEIKTINNRYRDFSIRMPRQLNSIEDRIRRKINEFVARGRIEVHIRFQSLKEQEKKVKIDLALLKGYYSALNQIKNTFPMLEKDIGIELMARFPEAIQVEDNEYDVEELWESLKGALNKALIQLDSARIEEGNNLKKDLLYRCEIIEKKVENIDALAPEIENEYKKRLAEKIIEYTGNFEIDETRLMTEVAIFADKSNITEEIIRLYSHMKQFKNTFKNELVGRKLDFIVQEMNREINTIGSKGNSYSISREVVDIKSELEKIREQIQNIE